LPLTWDVEEIWRATPEGDDLLQRELGKWCNHVINELKKVYAEEMTSGEDVLKELMDELTGH